MAQYTKSVSSPHPRASELNAGPIAMLIAGTFVVFAIALVGYVFTGEGQAPVTATAETGETIDGWMPAVSAANAAARQRDADAQRDGWSSALLRPEPEVVDGWAAALLRPEPEVVDGWAARYLVDD